MKLPAVVREPLDEVLEAGGFGRIRGTEPVGGGCIAETARVRATGGRDFFLKWTLGSEHPVGIFSAEASSLGALAATGVTRVPVVVHLRDGVAGGEASVHAGRWLLLEWLEPGSATRDTWSALGRDLAAVHRHRSDAWGWSHDNFIGTLPQTNAATDGWAEFWRERRLRPQLARAFDDGLLDESAVDRFERLFRALDEIVAPGETEGASLLHGDLWSGNLHVMASGSPALIDPSSYHGHREVDLAMSELFGGFDAAFLSAYEAAWPLQPGYAARRRAVYQLYYLLVHVNLFGASYAHRTLETLRATGF